MVSSKRALVTVLFTDIVGSTERAADLGDRRWRDLLQKHHELVRRELHRYAGREVSTAGDGFLATFEAPASAIRCACAVRDALRELGLEVRSGLHMGQVEWTGRTIGGIAVNIGARVASQARGGEVLVSGSLRDAEAGSGFGFEDRGVHELKGVPGEWRLFAVTRVPTPEVESPLARWSRALPARSALLRAVAVLAGLLVLGAVYFLARHGGESGPGEVLAGEAGPGIAVLPFSVHGPNLELWREGMVDVLSTGLDGAAGLRAIDSRTVLARWRESVEGQGPPDLAAALEAARRTGARYAVVGDAVAAGPGVRFTADIYELNGGAKLGQAQVEGSPDSIFQLADRFSIEILRALVQKGDVEIPPLDLARITTSSPAALKDFLEGEVLYRRSDFKPAIAAYRRAVHADSTFALALYRLGTVLGWTFEYDEGAEYLERAARRADRLPDRVALIVRLEELAVAQRSPVAIELARKAVQKYPEDPEVWYQLGEAYFHMGPRRLVGPEEAEEAFTRAIRLDPGFAPAYIHLIEMAFTQHADSALGSRLMGTYRRLAPGTLHDRLSQVALQLVFGDSAARRLARAALDTLQSPGIYEIKDFLGHPRSRAAEKEYLTALRSRKDPLTRELLFWFNIRYGKLRAALDNLNDPKLPARSLAPRGPRPEPWPLVAAEGLYTAHYLGMPVPRELLDRDLALSLPESTLTRYTFAVGLYAAESGRWAAHDSVVALVRRHAQEARDAKDSSAARVAEGMTKGLEGYALWKRGRPEEAMRLLEEAQRAAVSDSRLNLQLRWFLGRLLLETGRPKLAEAYFQSFWPCGCYLNHLPLSYFYLGKVYEELHQYEKARHSYELFALAWEEADPELQPIVEEARAAATRLTSVTGG